MGEDELSQRGRLYAAAARVAVDNHLHAEATEYAIAAVESDPSRADAVAVIEKLGDGPEGVAALKRVYGALARAALGRFGRRAAHYRAARQLEMRAAYEDALEHAVAAFEAAPSEGVRVPVAGSMATHASRLDRPAPLGSVGATTTIPLPKARSMRPRVWAERFMSARRRLPSSPRKARSVAPLLRA